MTRKLPNIFFLDRFIKKVVQIMLEPYMKIVNHLVNKRIINQEYSIIYQLGFDVLVTLLLQLICILLVGLILGDVRSAIWYTLCFCSIREYAGGYHANTRLGCTTIMIGIFILTFKLSLFWGSDVIFLLISGLLFFIDAVVFFLYAPMKTNRKRLKGEVIKRGKMVTLIVVITYGIVALLFFNKSIFIFTVLIETAVAALIIVCKPWRIKK